METEAAQKSRRESPPVEDGKIRRLSRSPTAAAWWYRTRAASTSSGMAVALQSTHGELFGGASPGWFCLHCRWWGRTSVMMMKTLVDLRRRATTSDVARPKNDSNSVSNGDVTVSGLCALDSVSVIGIYNKII
ncbi:hypothetical protein M6B38_236845 [Iris pallida]|uniref:Uncharacterized protein n=1 Tax=Iris pallida TaxID=29817 RepID=A0AAX6DMC1_IRIPA|nr:hypothetical protein M6B38_236845 [Iris pallida]